MCEPTNQQKLKRKSRKPIDKYTDSVYNIYSQRDKGLQDNTTIKNQLSAVRQEETAMKNVEKYFEKNGFVFIDAYNYNFGWHHRIYKFTNLEKAYEFLNKEQYDFQERELCSKTEAKKWSKEYIIIHDDGFQEVQSF